jgi:hypothetical protein
MRKARAIFIAKRPINPRADETSKREATAATKRSVIADNRGRDLSMGGAPRFSLEASYARGLIHLNPHNLSGHCRMN